ncbi:MAG: ATP-binding protein [Minisyncoccota bacterium]
MAALGLMVGALGIAAFAGGALFYLSAKNLVRRMGAQSDEMRQRMYELAILKEVGDRIGYSLNIQKIADVIIGSLNQFMGYSMASYMLLEPERIVFKVDIGESVPHRFVNEIKERMRLSLAAILDRDLGSIPVEETITGTLLNDATDATVESFFNIPLIIAGSAVGVLTVASTKNGLYKEKEMTMLYKIVGQASQAITRLEEVVTLERGKLQAMVESMEDGVLMTDQNFRVVVANSSLKESVNVPEGRDLTLFDIIDACGGTIDIKGRLEESIKLDRTFVAGEVNLMGSIYQVFIFPVKSRASKSLGVLGGGIIFHNITRERASEKLRDDFTSMMVHELRSPLDSIRKIGELLRTPAIRDDKNAYDEYMGMVSQSATNMLELVNDLLDVAKLEAGKFQIVPKQASIRKIIEERVKFFDTQARNATIALSVGFDDHIPEVLMVDPVRVGQVLSNLLSNAMKFTAPGGTVFTQALLHTKGVSVEDEVARAGFGWIVTDALKTLTDQDSCVVVSVTDTGQGISKENMARLFNKFEQFSASARSGEGRGTGLGLVIVRGIVEAHGGIVGVSSEEGKGSTFYFTLPV